MLTYILRRIAYSIPVLIVASMMVFGFVRATTDPTARLRASRDPGLITRERHRLGIDKPLVVQYVTEMGKLAKGDWGTSEVTHHSVKDDIQHALWNTMQLIVWGVLISSVIAIGVGVYSAVRQYSVLDYTFTGLAFIGLSMPPFWFGLMAIQFLGYEMKEKLGLKHVVFTSIGIGHGFSPYMRSLALPVLTLTVQIIASWSRYQRSTMLDVMSSDYIRTARAKGLPQRKVIFKHGLRNALIPLLTVMAVDIGALFGGLIVTETIFSWP